jgi:co-chaperonin GroES (HSP10)
MLLPVNRHLVIKVIVEEKKESGVLVPDDYKQDASTYSLVTLRCASPDSEFEPGSKLVVPTHMIEELNIFGEKYYVVLENHVVGILDD